VSRASSYHDSTEIDEDAVVAGLRTRRGRFVYNGTSIHIVGSGMEGIRQDLGYDGRDLHVWKAYIDMLAGLQTEHVRMRLRFNPWAFCRGEGEYCGSPWVHQNGQYDLGRFDEEFWSLVHSIAEYADEKGLLMEFVLFDARSFFRGRHAPRWDRHPFNAAVGGPIEGPPLPAFYNLAEPESLDLFRSGVPGSGTATTRLQGVQQAYVFQAVRALDALQNVCWEIVNEIEGSDPVRVGFVSHFVEFLRRHDPIDRLVACSGKSPLRGDAAYFRITGIDAVHFHMKGGAYDAHYDIVETILELAQYGKPVVNDEADWTPSRADGGRRSGLAPKEVRWALWQSFLAGGSTTAPRWQPFEHSAVHDWIAVFAGIAESLALARLEYRVDAIPALPSGVNGNGAVGGEQAVIYLTSDSPVPKGQMRVHLPAGHWDGEAVDPRDGSRRGDVSLGSTGATVDVDIPAFEEDLVVLLKQRGE
jgi:hypothetical protein